MGLAGLSQLNVELTSRCHRRVLCSFCFHQASPDLKMGDMHMNLVRDIRQQVPSGIVVQFHRDGDPLAYPQIREALEVFDGCIRSIVTHGETLMEQAEDLIERCETITVSVFSPDPDADMQFQAVREFLAEKGDALPRVLVKVVGDCNVSRYEALGVPILRRRLHTATNGKYVKTVPMMPEHGVCTDFLSHPAISWDGKVYQCVRFDDTDAGYLGSLYEHTLDEIWNGETRRNWLDAHVQGRRDLASPRCATCTYYGIPTH